MRQRAEAERCPLLQSTHSFTLAAEDSCMRSLQCNVEYGRQLSARDRTEPCSEFAGTGFSG